MMKTLPQSLKILIVFAALFVSNSGAFAALKNDLQFKMKTESELEIVAQLTNSEPREVRLKLGPQIKIKTLKGLKVQKSVDGSVQLVLGAQDTGIAEYTISTDFKKAPALFLTEQDFWIPVLISNQRQSIQTIYSLKSDLPANIHLIHSATGVSQDDLAFVLCKCRKFSNSTGTLNVYLKNEEPELAKVLLFNLETYLEKFEKLYGPYPFDQFSVVESPDEIGAAFPRMTWIGTQLLHFPFILKTSLPHELLHSWWGHGVRVDDSRGNWCEGLTTFGADYGLLSENEKKIYRVKAITNFLNYARTPHEIPLSQFLSRGEDRSLQAIGYDKALMVFVMIEARVGRQVFAETLKNFYLKYRHKKASFEDFFSVLTATAKKDFTEFKKFWLYSKGLLPNDIVQLNWQENPHQLHFETASSLSNLKSLAGMPLSIALQMPDQTIKIITQKVREDGQDLETKNASLSIRPLSYTFDQDFLLLREMSSNEKPVTFSQYFANQNVKIFSQDRALTSALSSTFPSTRFIETQDLKEMGQSPLVVATLDQALRVSEVRKELGSRGFEFTSQQLKYQGKIFDLNETSLFLTLRIGSTKLFILTLSQLQAPSRWFQRLSHYGDKSYLILNDKTALIQGVWLEPAPIKL